MFRIESRGESLHIRFGTAPTRLPDEAHQLDVRIGSQLLPRGSLPHRCVAAIAGSRMQACSAALWHSDSTISPGHVVIFSVCTGRSLGKAEY
jgi:hypothetical protein